MLLAPRTAASLETAAVLEAELEALEPVAEPEAEEAALPVVEAAEAVLVSRVDEAAETTTAVDPLEVTGTGTKTVTEELLAADDSAEAVEVGNVSVGRVTTLEPVVMGETAVVPASVGHW